jgi:hypothetical protein
VREDVMTDKDVKSEDSNPERSSSDQDHAVGYGRPPTHSRFKPGPSGNPKGRRKGARNLTTLRRELYLNPVKIRVGEQIKKVPGVLAIDAALIARALRGDAKAAQLVSKNATELAVYDESFPVDTGYPMNLTKEQMGMLTDEELAALIKILGRVHGGAGPS